jgi:nucleoside transporter
MTDAETCSTVRKSDPRLHLMMFLEYAVKGMWFPLASVFLVDQLGFDDAQKGYIIGVPLAVGAFLAPFIAGQLADRYFSTQRFLGVLLMIGGILKFVTAYQTAFSAWLWLSIGFAIVYVPTVSLTNSLAMMHLNDPKKQFPSIRLWGTIGWIAAGWIFSMVWLKTNVRPQLLPPFFTGDAVPNEPARMLDAVKVAGILCFAYGLYCMFALPHTPPKRGAGAKLAFAKAFGLVRHRSFALLLFVGLLISITHTIYFIQAGKFLKAIGLDGAYILPAMSIGQFAEILMLALLGVFLSRLGFRFTLALGALCFGLRYLIFGTGVLAFVIPALFLHGFCFACFVTAAFIYVDRVAPRDVRHSVQTVFSMVLFGAGPLIAGWLNSVLVHKFTPAGGELDYSAFWFAMSSFGIVAAILIALFFRDETTVAEEKE